MKLVYTKERFVAKARLLHGNKYNYNESDYQGCKIPIKIICPIHGEFWQTPDGHLKGSGCSKCASQNISKSHSSTTEEFIKRAIEKYGDRFDYSRADYKNNHTKITIGCPIHGWVDVDPNSFLNRSKYGCPKCARAHQGGRVELDEFIRRAREVHGDKYDYSKVEYKGMHTKVCIICPIHGEFWMTPTHHMRGQGCPVCGIEKSRHFRLSNKEEFIAKAILIHGDKFDYSKTEYKGNKEKVCIICPKHGEFYQTPDSHLRGAGCPKCKRSIGEEIVSQILTDIGIDFVTQYVILLQRNLFGVKRLYVDFYIPKYKTIIECNGIQHYEYNEFFHDSRRSFEKQQHRDKTLKVYCKNNELKLIEIDGRKGWDSNAIYKTIQRIIKTR